MGYGDGRWLQPKGGWATVDRRLFLKLMGAGTGSVALASNGNHLLTPTAADGAVESETIDAAVSEFIANPPFSFTYGGLSSAILLHDWRAVRRKISSSPGRSEESVTWRAPSGGPSSTSPGRCLRGIRGYRMDGVLRKPFLDHVAAVERGAGR
jgi:hypothetical protein